MVFGPVWQEVAGGWRKLCDEQLHGLCIRNQVEDVMGAKCGTREERLMHRVLLLVREHEGKDHLEDKSLDGRKI